MKNGRRRPDPKRTGFDLKTGPIDGLVVVVFNQPVHTMSLPPYDARVLGSRLIRDAASIDGRPVRVDEEAPG